MGIIYQSVPIGAIQTTEEAKRDFYITKILDSPKKIQDILFSSDTGAFVRGLAKSYDVDINSSPKIALAILFIAIGEKTLVQLAAILSTELKLPNDKAQKMAAEIEKDVFGPVKNELETFLREQKLKGSSITSKLHSSDPTSPNPSSGRRGNAYAPQNVLNLKELPARRPQTALPAKPQVRLPKPVSSTLGATRIPLTPSLSPSRERAVEGRTPSVFPAAPRSPLLTKERPGEVRKPPAPLPPPLTPPRAGGEAPRFPLPPHRPPEESKPIRFT